MPKDKNVIRAERHNRLKAQGLKQRLCWVLPERMEELEKAEIRLRKPKRSVPCLDS